MGLPFENADYNEDEVGAKKIPELTDVVLTNIQNNNVLVYNNGIWENQAQSGGSSITELDDIPGVTITNVQNNQFLKYDSGEWINSNITDNDTDNLNDLTDTLLTTPFGNDEVLKYSGGKWKNGNIPIEKLSNVHISNLQDGETLRYVHQNTRWENAYNIDTLDELSDVTISSNLNNHVLKYSNTDGVYKNAYLNVTDLGDTNITTLANGNILIYNNGEWSAGNITYTETDPVFTISPAGSIIHGTGFLKNNGGTWSYDTNTYLTSYTETDPVFTISPAGSITNGNGFLKNNGSGTWSYETNVVVATASRVGTWDTAYGWGNHAIQGYSIGQSVATSDSPSFNQLTLGSVGNNSGIINLKDTTNLGVETIAQMKGILNVTNGGQLEFQTKVNGGILTKKMVISENGKTEFFTDTGTISILSADGTSQQSFIYNSTNGTRDLTIDCYSAVTNKGISFQTGGVRRMRITNTGEFLFGLSNHAGSTNDVLTSGGGVGPPYWAPQAAPVLPANPTFTNVTINGLVTFPNSSPDSAKNDILCRNLGNYAGGPQNHMALRSRGAEVLVIYYDIHNGHYVWANVAHYAASYNPTSDDRIKSNEKPITEGVSVIEKLQPKIYDKHQNHRVPADKEDNDLTGIHHFKESGFIAQEVDKIPELKHLVKYNKTNDLYALSYEGIIPYLVQSIKELNARIKTLEGK